MLESQSHNRQRVQKTLTAEGLVANKSCGEEEVTPKIGTYVGITGI
jgi:hypothetical protein